MHSKSQDLFCCCAALPPPCKTPAKPQDCVLQWEIENKINTNSAVRAKMVLETKGKHRSYKTRDQRWRQAPLPPLHPYLHSRAGVSSHWAAGWGEWCCRSHGAECILSRSRCFSSGVHRPEQITPHVLLTKSCKRALWPRQSMQSKSNKG